MTERSHSDTMRVSVLLQPQIMPANAVLHLILSLALWRVLSHYHTPLTTLYISVC